MQRTLDVLTSLAATAARLGAGAQATHGARQPDKPLELYEYESCRYCRQVREALTTLDLDAIIYPCPKGGTVYRPKAPAREGKQRFPVLIDPNTGQTLHGARHIIDHLFTTYGAPPPPLHQRLTPLVMATSELASAIRLYRGRRAIPSHQPQELLELYSFEASPFARIARETLCELELAYVLHNVGKAAAVDWLPPGIRTRWAPEAPQTTAHRRAFVERSGKMMVPYLIDPNTGAEMFESAAIRRYLLDTYAR